MHALNPFNIRTCVHFYRALFALRSTASLFIRLPRYNMHMAIVRRLNAHPAPHGSGAGQ